MTDLQKRIFEKTIAAIKAKDGEFHFYSVSPNTIQFEEDIDINAFNKNRDIVEKNLRDEGYVKSKYKTDPWTVLLTPKGWEFTTFSDLSEKEKQIQEPSELEGEQLKKNLQKMNLEIETLVNTISDYDKVKRQTRLSLLCSVVSAIAAVIAIWIALKK
jgi:hypothetical protein